MSESATVTRRWTQRPEGSTWLPRRVGRGGTGALPRRAGVAEHGQAGSASPRRGEHGEVMHPGRGVMIDLEGHFGRSGGDRTATSSSWVCWRRTRSFVEPGDLVCLRTGFAEMLLGMNKQPDAELLRRTNCTLDGRDERLLQWINGYPARGADRR